MSDAATPSLPLNENEDDRELTGQPQHQEPVRWKVVADARGLLPARIIADRLQTEGIPARAWQESVGQAYGMTIGPLGTGYVSVPEDFVEQAQEILAQSAALEEEPEDADADEDDRV